MRADRLVATLLLLQARDRVTAAELAEELEVSLATARRDLEALSSAGIPVYPQAGRGGGWSLLGGARTDLSGLSSPEAQSLFLLLGPAAAIDPAAKAALRKLVRALPATFRADAEAAAGAVLVDPAAWGGSQRARPEFLDDLQAAVVRRVAVRLRYAGWSSPEADYAVAPWGLVEKNEVWYLVGGVEPSAARGSTIGSTTLADGGLVERTFRVDRIRSLVLTDAPIERPADFDLGDAWNRVVAGVESERTAVSAIVIVAAPLLSFLRSQFGLGCEVLEQLEEGRSRVRVSAPTATMIARQLAGWGAFAQVLEPGEVRAELARIAAQLTTLYGPP
ncbi:helix-turn-helix transcriptional regulator [Herbiconiux daphne]|uniref:WYL domain-containing protein n=1 Tax=Herbiconiux daphne TaxID=2970914 RepID=A0ABT2H0C5_9MICO|nr:WYL domain-containing protein [Herbiconiux daphne]MCS5732824.1 WYL domain-containing protein [Herbiconiux daphne]